MRYSDLVASAPPGSSRFGVADLGRLSRSTISLALEPGPATPPLGDLALGLGGDQELLQRIAIAIPARSERLMRLAARPATPDARTQAGRRLVKGLFWWLVYELQPLLWLRLAAAESLHPGLVDALDCGGKAVLEVAAGAGRLTLPMLERHPGPLVAIEPSPTLRQILKGRTEGRAWVVAGAGQRLPVRAGWADLVVSCATFGPHPPLGGEALLAELERCARPGGAVALLGPEDPAWFADRGYGRRWFDPRVLPDRLDDPELARFFGPHLRPPHELVIKRL